MEVQSSSNDMFSDQTSRKEAVNHETDDLSLIDDKINVDNDQTKNNDLVSIFLKFKLS